MMDKLITNVGSTHSYSGLLFCDLNSRSLLQLKPIRNFTETLILKPQKLCYFIILIFFISAKSIQKTKIFETLKTSESIEIFLRIRQ